MTPWIRLCSFWRARRQRQADRWERWHGAAIWRQADDIEIARAPPKRRPF